MFEKNENLLGLDVGSSNVKIICVSTKQSTLKLLECGLVPVPREALTEGRVSKPELVAGQVQRLLSNLKLKKRSVATSISGYEVMIKKIELPTMTEEELHNRMYSELGQYIPYNIEEVDVDYQILDVSKDRPNFMDVLLVAAKKDSVAEHLGIVRQCGFDPMVIDVDYFALSNAFEATYGFGEENIAMIDIGASKAIMNIISKGVPVFTRGISIGGNQITDKIREQFRVSADEAERIKLGESSNGASRKDLENIFTSVVRNWVSDCKRAVDFYYSNYPDKRIEKVFLSGGACRLPGLDRTFAENMNAGVEIFNPLTRMQYDSKVFDQAYLEYVGPHMAIALGLALRRTKEK